MKPLVRIFSPFFPYPPTEGAFQVVIGQLHEFATQNRVELIYWKHTELEAAALSQLNSLEPFPENVTTVHLNTRSEHGLTGRLYRVIRSLFSRYSSPEAFYYPEAKPAKFLETAALEIFHYSFCRRYLEAAIGNATKRVCYFHNIESKLFKQRAAAERNILKRLILKRTIKQLERNEQLVTKYADESWFISAVDLETAHRKFNLSYTRTRCTPPTFSSAFEKARKLSRNRLRVEDRVLRVGLLGALDFKPNEDSAFFVINELCPKIENLNLPCEIILAGKRPSKKLLTAARNYPFVKVLGFVEEIESFWAQIDCMIVPHISGSGVRIKMLEALASGITVIANPEAIEPLSLALRANPLFRINSLDMLITEIKKLSDSKVHNLQREFK